MTRNCPCGVLLAGQGGLGTLQLARLGGGNVVSSGQGFLQAIQRCLSKTYSRCPLLQKQESMPLLSPCTAGRSMHPNRTLPNFLAATISPAFNGTAMDCLALWPRPCQILPMGAWCLCMSCAQIDGVCDGETENWEIYRCQDGSPCHWPVASLVSRELGRKLPMPAYSTCFSMAHPQ